MNEKEKRYLLIFVTTVVSASAIWAAFKLFPYDVVFWGLMLFVVIGGFALDAVISRKRDQ